MTKSDAGWPKRSAPAPAPAFGALRRYGAPHLGASHRDG